MTDALAQPPFPFQLEALAAPGTLERLSTLELGAFVHLVRFAWHQDPPCTLPDEVPSLAAVAGVTLEEWATAEPRLLLALQASRGHPAGRLTLSAALRAYHAQASTAERGRRQRVAAAQSRWSKTPGPEPGQGSESMRVACGPHATRMRPASAAPEVRSEFSPALQPQRSPEVHEFDLSARAPGREVIGKLGEGARAIAIQELVSWRRAKSIEMLHKALAGWRSMTPPATNCPLAKASELADGPDSSPQRVEHILEVAAATLMQARAAGKPCNPVGIVINGLGLGGTRFGRPVEVPLWVANRWAKLESEQFKSLQAAAAVRALQLARVPHVPPVAGDRRAANQGA